MWRDLRGTSDSGFWFLLRRQFCRQCKAKPVNEMTPGYWILTFSCLAYGLQLSLFERTLGAEENNRRVRKAKLLHLACLKSSYCLPFSIWKSRHCNHRYGAVRIARGRCWKTWLQGKALLQSVGPEHDLYFCNLSCRLRCLGDFTLGSKEGCLGFLAPESSTTFNRWPDSAC